MKNQSLNIAVVTDAVFPFNKGGKETRIFQITTELSKLGHTVHIYTMKWWKGDDVIILDGITYHAISRHYPLYHGNRRSITQSIFFALSCFKLVNYDFDMIEVDHMPFLLLFPVKLVSLIKRRPMFATWHEVWGLTYWKQYLGVAGYLAAMIEYLSVRLPNHIVAVSPHTEELLRSKLHYRGLIDVIPNGINSVAIRAVKPAAIKSDVIYAGRLLPNKNVNLLIEAIGIVVKTRPKIRCVIIGDGPERKALQDLVTDLGLTKSIHFTGFIESNDQVYSNMKASRIFVLPSVREGFGISVIEAFAVGLMVVTVDHPENAARHLISPQNGLIAQVSSGSIAGAITSLLNEKHVSSRVAATTEYTWPILANKLSELYKR